MSLELNIQSFIQPVLYILNKAGKPLDTHKISKILYFADRQHLAKYGTTISGDTYMKMQYGPVPSTVYDIIKTIQGRKGLISAELVSPFLSATDGNKIMAISDFDAERFRITKRAEIDVIYR